MKKLVREFDALLNMFTMYRTLAYGLSTLAGIAILMSAVGSLSLKTAAMCASLAILVGIAYVSNKAISRFWNVPSNSESWYITALVLFFILPPATTIERGIYAALAVLIAIASKYIIAVNGKHIFNPAAFGAFIVGAVGLMHTSWWIGSSALWIPALLYGLVVVHKIRKFTLLWSFVAASLLVSVVVTLLDGGSISKTLDFAITASPLIFLGTIMLTEPSTMPARRNQIIIFGGLVGTLYAWHPSIGPFFLYPEIALLIGNIYAFALSSRRRMILRLKRIEDISDNVKNYVFDVKNKPTFLAGQYSEWTLGQPHADGRGNRRTFTIASSPTEKEIHLGMKFYDPGSSFKGALKVMKPGDTIYGGTIGGDFVLPRDTSEKLTFIAGGIGITPFRSMLKYIIDTNQKRDIVLYYLVSNPNEIAYEDIFKEAKSCGLKIIYICAHAKKDNFYSTLDQSTIKQTSPDYLERLTYISGPHAMVAEYQQFLTSLGVKRHDIKTDHFSGY